MSPADVTYGESLRLFWRLYWLPTLFATITAFVLGVLFNEIGPVTGQILSTGVFLGFLVLLVPRIFQPFKTFKLEVVTSDGQAVHVAGMRHMRLAVFILLQLFGVVFAVAFLLIPLNLFFSLFRINLTQPIALGSLFFVAGPYTMKMMVGRVYSDFHVEVRRPRTETTCTLER